MPVHISTSQNSSFSAFNTNNETYILDPLAAITATENLNAVFLNQGTVGIAFVVEGIVRTDAFSKSAIFNRGDSNRVEIAKSGKVEGYFGVESLIGDLTVVNDGFIEAGQIGVLMSSTSGRVTNNGQITGAYGISMNDTNLGSFSFQNNGFLSATVTAIVAGAVGNTIKLGKESVVFGSGDYTIYSDTEGTTSVNNAGLIRATSGVAYRGSDSGTDTFINSGHVIGNVDLRGGADFFLLKAGEVDGAVTGGQGNDTFTIKSGNVSIFETPGQGFDILKTAKNYALDVSSEIEKIVLTGKKNIGVTGDISGNDITGNGGNNRLDGYYGNDTLTGGKGRDIFVFGEFYGSDTITDFSHGQDKIGVNFDGATGFRDLILQQLGKDVVIDFGNELLTILDTKVKDFDRGDFLFD